MVLLGLGWSLWTLACVIVAPVLASVLVEAAYWAGFGFGAARRWVRWRLRR